MEKKKMSIELKTGIYKKLLEISDCKGETLECLVEEILEETICDLKTSFFSKKMEEGYIEMSELNSLLSEMTVLCDEEELEDYEMNLMGSE